MRGKLGEGYNIYYLRWRTKSEKQKEENILRWKIQGVFFTLPP